MENSMIEVDDDSSLASTYEHFDPIDEDHPVVNTDKRPLHRDDSMDSQQSNKQWPSHSGSCGGPVEHKYEDFASKLTLQCPTCKGKGKLTQSMGDLSFNLPKCL